MNRVPDLTDRPVLAAAEDMQPLLSAVQQVLPYLRDMDMTGLDAPLAQRLVALERACDVLHSQLRGADTSAPITPDALLDRAVFDRLMDLAGPDAAHDLLDHLVEDLTGVRDGLEAAHHGPDWEGLRIQSHILIGLAGAVGAQTLQARAQDVNEVANQRASASLDPLLASLMPGLVGLIRFVQRQRMSVVVAG
jgi:two-component system, OmpR family, aerobic respiration control sensor histidine kinase ArcB